MSLLFCIKHTCYKTLAFLRIIRQKPKVHKDDDVFTNQAGRITMSAWQQDEEPIKSDKTKQTKKQKQKQEVIAPTVSDSLLDQSGGLLITDEPTQSLKKSSIPTKDESSSLLETPNHIQPAVKQLQQPKAFNFNTQSFKINLEPYENFYQILQTKTKNLQQKLNTNSAVVQIGKTDSSLQILHTQSGKLNIFTYQFQLPCSYSFYSQMLNDYVLQKKLDPNIDQYKMLELYANNLRLNYLSYKKVLIVSPRDFVYLKYSNSVDNQYWDVSFSIPWQAFSNRVRGQILLSACKIIENDNKIFVQVYSEVDMKLAVSAKITKNQAVNQIKKYVDKCDKYIKENYKKELV